MSKLRALRISKGVVGYVGLAAAAGLDWATACTLDEAALEQRLLPSRRSDRRTRYRTIAASIRKLPARARRPQDKAKVEFAVQLVERWVLARLRHQRFASVEEVDRALQPLMLRLNQKPSQKMPGNPAAAFAALDAPALLPLPLPVQRYQIARFKTAKVNIDYHVEVEAHRYSVPHALVGQELDVRITRQ